MESIESRIPELKAMDVHAQELTTSLSSDPVCVAEALVDKKFIQHELLFKMLRDDTPTGRANILFEAVRKEMEAAPEKFTQFLEILSEQALIAKEVVESLQSTYQGEFSE